MEPCVTFRNHCRYSVDSHNSLHTAPDTKTQQGLFFYTQLDSNVGGSTIYRSRMVSREARSISPRMPPPPTLQRSATVSAVTADRMTPLAAQYSMTARASVLLTPLSLRTRT